MIRYWQQFATKFDAMSRREQLILLLAILAVIYLLWFLLALGPAEERKEKLRNQVQTLDGRILDLQAQEQVFVQASGLDPNASKKRQVEHLRQQLSALDEELQTLSVGLVPADMLPQVLHDVLATTGDLELLGMQTLPVQRLSITGGDPDVTNEGAEAAQQVDVFRHAVELKLRGGYFAVSRYLKSLEDLQWRFYWDRLNYEVTDYPSGVATLEVFTLSAGEGLLGE